jgi:hypothetical protein
MDTPRLQESRCLLGNLTFDLPKLLRRIADISRQRDGLKPLLRGVPGFVDVNVGRFRAARWRRNGSGSHSNAGQSACLHSVADGAKNRD